MIESALAFVMGRIDRTIGIPDERGLAAAQDELPDSALFHTVIWRKTEVGGVGAQSGPSQGQVEGTSLTPPMGEVVGGVVGEVDLSICEKILISIGSGEKSTSDITQQYGWSRVYGGLSRALKNLMADGIIEYTIPEKPRSRLQKYRLTQKGRQMLAQNGTKLP